MIKFYFHVTSCWELFHELFQKYQKNVEKTSVQVSIFRQVVLSKMIFINLLKQSFAMVFLNGRLRSIFQSKSCMEAYPEKIKGALVPSKQKYREMLIVSIFSQLLACSSVTLLKIQHALSHVFQVFICGVFSHEKYLNLLSWLRQSCI